MRLPWGSMARTGELQRVSRIAGIRKLLRRRRVAGESAGHAVEQVELLQRQLLELLISDLHRRGARPFMLDGSLQSG